MGEVHWSSRKTQPWRSATRFATRSTAAAGSRSSRTCLVSRGPHIARKVRSTAAVRRRALTYTCDASVHSASSVSATAVAKCFRSFPVERDGTCFGNQGSHGVPMNQQFVPPSPPSRQPVFGQQYGEESHRSPAAPFGLGEQSNGGLDVLSKTEKWLPGLPKPGHEAWKDREMEIVGFHDYLVELRSWASLVSPKFAAEIAEAVATSQEIVLAMLTREQQSRAGRLLSILKAAFTGHGRAENIIRAFCEGITFGPASAVQGGFAFNDNGYELLRILAREFTLQTRAEALALRNELLQKQFSPQKNETSPGTVVADTIRRLECGLARFSKLLSTLPSSVDRVGVEVNEADTLVLLLRSLPTQCAEFVLLHSAQENYSMARQTAIRYETQRRLYLDWNSFGQKPGKLLHEVNKTEVYDMAAGDSEQPGGDDAYVEAIAGRCSKCGSKRHDTSSCSVDLSRTKCFKCGGTGHVSMNCTKSGSSASSAQKGSSGAGKGAGNSKGSASQKGTGGKPSKGKGKDKGKSKGKSGKGKMFEVGQGDSAAEDWWFQDETGYWWAATAEWSEVTASAQEPEQEGSPATTEQGTTPIAATLIAGLFSGAALGTFASNNNLFISNQTETMGMKHVKFSELHGSERLAVVNLCSHDMFPVCFRVEGNRSEVTEGLQHLVDVVVTCDEAWEWTRRHGDWYGLALGTWNVGFASEMFVHEVFFTEVIKRNCEHVHGSCVGHVQETVFESFHETRVGRTFRTSDSLVDVAGTQTKRRRKRQPNQLRQGDQVSFSCMSCPVSEGALSCHGTCRHLESPDLSSSSEVLSEGWTLHEQMMHEFPGLRCRHVHDLEGPGRTSDWTSVMCGLNWVSTGFACRMLPLFCMILLLLFLCFGVVESHRDTTQYTRELREDLCPILSQIQHTESGYWLLDSGAAATVVSQETFSKFKAAGKASELRPSTQAFYAANGSPVVVQGEVKLVGYVLASSQGMTQPVVLELNAVVGATQHDILSTNQCNARGWTFNFSTHVSTMTHDETGFQVSQVTTWGGCPWIAFSPTISELSTVLSASGSQLQSSDHVHGVSAQQNSNMSPIVHNMAMVGHEPEVGVEAVQTGKLTEAEMASHRLRGHVPFAAWCSHCVKAKGIKQHRRRSKDDRLQVALAADFLHLGDFKVLALHERSTSSIGAVVMTSDVARDRNVFCKWLQEMGVSSTGGVSIQLTTDAEPAVASFITGASQGHQWMVEKASPQNHDFIGAAERTVRTIKEGLALIQSELAEQHMTLAMTVQSLSDVLRYICHSQNLFSHAHASDRTPKELATGTKLKGANFCTFPCKGLGRDP